MKGAVVPQAKRATSRSTAKRSTASRSTAAKRSAAAKRAAVTKRAAATKRSAAAKRAAATRRASSRRPSQAAIRREAERSIKRLEKSLEDAQGAIGSLGKNLGRGGRDLYKDESVLLRSARRD